MSAPVFQMNFVQDIKRPIMIQHCGNLVFTGDNLSDTVSVSVLEDGEPYAISGTVAMNCIRADGATVTVTGSVSGNTASATLTQACVAIPGPLAVVIKVTSDSTTTTLLKAVYMVDVGVTGTAVDPGTIIPDVTTLINAIETAVGSIPADYSDLLATIAPNFASGTYSAGSYVWNNGTLYKFTADHSGSWTGTDVETVVIGDELTNLKSAVQFIENGYMYLNPTLNSYVGTDGAIGHLNGFYASDYLEIGNEKYIIIKTSFTQNDNYSSFYNGNKEQISNFRLYSGENIIAVPSTAKYFRITINDNPSYLTSTMVYGITKYLNDEVIGLSRQLNVFEKDVNRLNLSVIKSSNVPVKYENNVFQFVETVDTGFPYAFFNRNVATFSQTVNPNDSWIILIEYSNGVFVVNTNSSNGYYLSYDAATMVVIPIGINTSNYDVTAKVYEDGFSLSVNGVTKLFNYHEFENQITDTFVRYQLGYARNKDASTSKKPCTIKFAVPNINVARKWVGKTGDFLGDSITAQHKYTDALVTNYNIIVNNYGISGTTISNINSSNTFSSRVSSMSATCDFVFMLGGTNDWGLGAPLGTKIDTTENTFFGGLYVTLSALRSKFPLKPIFVSTILQRNWQGEHQASGIDDNGNGVSLAEFNEAIIYMAHRFGCIIVDGFGESGICVSNLSSYTSDNVHLNDFGGIRYADFIMDNMDIVTPY